MKGGTAFLIIDNHHRAGLFKDRATHSGVLNNLLSQNLTSN